MSIVVLKEDRARTLAELELLRDGSNGRRLDERELERFQALKTELEDLDNQIVVRSRMDELAREKAKDAENRYRPQYRDFDIRKLIRHQMNASLPTDDMGYERELSRELRRNGPDIMQDTGYNLVPMEALFNLGGSNYATRALATTGAGVGADLGDPLHLGSEWVSWLHPMSVISRLGIRTLSGLTGTVNIPSFSGAAMAAGWQTEGGNLVDTSLATTNLAMTPKKLGMLGSFTRQLLMDSNPAVDQLFRTEFIAAMQDAVEAAVFNGVTNGPASLDDGTKGATVDDRGGATHTNGLAFAKAEVFRVQEVMDLAHISADGRRWAMNPKQMRKLQQVDRGTDTGQWMVTDGQSLLGESVVPTTHISHALSFGTSNVTSDIYYGDFSEFVLGMWQGVEIMYNPYGTNDYMKDSVGVRAIMYTDSLLKRRASILRIPGVL